VTESVIAGHRTLWDHSTLLAQLGLDRTGRLTCP
jgi:hypothetical protein